jgi:Ca-activated chloride channel family protein
MNCIPFVVLSLSLIANAWVQTEPYQISVNVDLVVVHATVRDRRGAAVSHLTEKNFEVFEDGVRQSIRLFRHEDLPVTIGLVIDHSGSMRHKIADVMAAAQTFARASNSEDQMFVVNFNEVPRHGLPPEALFTNRPAELENAIASMPVTGQTALYDAIVLALERLESSNREKKALIVISDGGDNASRHTLARALQLAERSNALVYTVGIYENDAPDRNPEVLRKFAVSTGAEAYFPAEIKDVVAVCERIARDIRNQYTLGYLSTNRTEDRVGGRQYRRIRVVANGYAVRARPGYSTDRHGRRTGVK